MRKSWVKCVKCDRKRHADTAVGQFCPQCLKQANKKGKNLEGSTKWQK
jgi:hypothetical protein